MSDNEDEDFTALDSGEEEYDFVSELSLRCFPFQRQGNLSHNERVDSRILPAQNRAAFGDV